MRWPSKSTIVLLLLAAYLSLLTVHPVIDDYWVNVVVGREIAQTQSIPDSDVFSFSEGDWGWVPHMWLSRGLMAVVDDVGGLGGTRLVFILLSFGFFLAVGWFYRALELPTWGVALGLGLVFVLSLERFRYRPTIFTMAFLYAGVAFLVALWPNPKRWHLVALYLFTALWVNLHSGGLIFPLVVCAMAGADVVGGLWQRQWTKKTMLRVGAAGATVLGSFTSPYTYHLWIYIFEPKPLQAKVPEYFSPLSFLHPDRFDLIPLSHVPIVLLPGLAVLLLASPLLFDLGRSCWRAIARRGEPGELARWLKGLPQSAPLSFYQLAACMPLLYLAVKHVRFMYMAGIPLGFLLARRRTGIAEGKPIYTVVVLATIACLSLGSFVRSSNVIPVLQRSSFHIRSQHWPVGSVRYLQERQTEGNIFCKDVQWNGYLLYHLYPNCRTFFDTRHTYGPARIPAEADEIYRAAPRQSELLRRYDVDILIAKRAFRFAPGEQRRWKVVYRTTKPPFDTVYLRIDPE